MLNPSKDRICVGVVYEHEELEILETLHEWVRCARGWIQKVNSDGNEVLRPIENVHDAVPMQAEAGPVLSISKST